VYTELAQYTGSALGDGHHVLLVVGASESGGGTVAGNLASALARTRGETVLICADPDGAAIPRLLGASDRRGFAELLAGTAAVAEVTKSTADVPLLRVITPGLDAAGAVYDMRHDTVQRIMRELRREVRYVIVDVPPPSLDADTFSVAEFADAAIVAVEAGTARPSEVTDCLQRLERVRTPALAAVLLPRAGRASTIRGRRGEVMDSSVPYTPEPSTAQPYTSRSRQPSRDEIGGSNQPVIRPVTRRSAGSAGSFNGGSRHAAGRHSESADEESSASPFSSAWTPRSVSETWPLPQVAPQDSTDEAGASDPLIGN
jgi:Mrp family chromosome partitioning ATPase